MCLNYVITKVIFFSVMICLILFTSGCMENPKLNSIEPQITPLVSPIPLTTPQPSLSALKTQNQNGSSSPSIIPITTITPHFYGTISYGSNRSSTLTEDQAWKYAEAFFLKAGIRDIQPSQVVPLGQGIWKDKEDNQRMVWTFEVNRMKSGINYGGVIFIDAYDGHVVSYSGFQ